MLFLKEFEERCQRHKIAQRTDFKRYFEFLPESHEFLIPTVTSNFNLNLKDASMLIYDHENHEFKVSPIVCACSFCIDGRFESCLKNQSSANTVPLLIKQFKNVKTEKITKNVILEEENFSMRNNSYIYNLSTSHVLIDQDENLISSHYWTLKISHQLSNLI